MGSWNFGPGRMMVLQGRKERPYRKQGEPKNEKVDFHIDACGGWAVRANQWKRPGCSAKIEYADHGSGSASSGGFDSGPGPDPGQEAQAQEGQQLQYSIGREARHNQ
jgi:hypothetical protein